jgi:hypothetical protein
MSTTTNPLTIRTVRSRPGRVLATAGGVVAAIACAIALAAGGSSENAAIAPAGQGAPHVRQGSDPAILHHHWLDTAEPSAAERRRQAADRFHHR